jgi:hypothetical protein
MDVIFTISLHGWQDSPFQAGVQLEKDGWLITRGTFLQSSAVDEHPHPFLQAGSPVME